MGIQLNFGDHVPWFKDFKAIPLALRADAQWIRAQAKAIANTKPSANAYFRALPGHRTLSALLADGSIWVNYFDNPAAGGQTYTMRGFSEIAIDSRFWNSGRLAALGVLIHELAHVNGAPGDTSQAEDSLVHCGLGSPFELHTGIDLPDTPYRPGATG
jgi:hypothetical protein